MRIVIMVFCLAVWCNLSAQNKTATGISGQRNQRHNPVIVIDTTVVYGVNNLIFNMSNVASAKLVKPDSAVILYGERAAHGAVVVTTKQRATFIRLEAILDAFNISKEDRHLRVCINKSLIEEPLEIVAERNELLKVEITTDRNWRYYQDGNNKERYINIVTRQGSHNDL